MGNKDTKSRISYAIGDVRRRTGLSERTLRHYESEGLLSPGRTSAGRRIYGTDDLAAIMRIRVFKRAGFTIAQIRSMLAGDGDLRRYVEAQHETLEQQQRQIGISLKLLRSVKSRLDKNEEIDSESFLDLIKSGEANFYDDQWQKIYDRYYTPEEQREWVDRKVEMADFDCEDYNQSWADLLVKIEKALPLEPDSKKAQNLLDEWNVLMKPFDAIATPQMMEGASNLWRNIDDWKDEVETPISVDVIKFISAAKDARDCSSS